MFSVARLEEFARTVDRMVTSQNELGALRQRVRDTLEGCLRPLALTDGVRQCNALMEQIHAKAGAIIDEVRRSKVVGSRLNDVLELCENGRNLVNIVDGQVGECPLVAV